MVLVIVADDVDISSNVNFANIKRANFTSFLCLEIGFEQTFV